MKNMFSVGAYVPEGMTYATLVPRIKELCGQDLEICYPGSGNFSITTKQMETAERIQATLALNGFRMRDSRPWRAD